MCNFSKGFILCTCKDDNQQSANNADTTVEYIWTLNKHAGPTDGREVGRYAGPTSDIGSGLTAEFVLQNLNSRNCFDFDYKPSEGDNLILEAELTDLGYEIIKKIFDKKKSASEEIHERPHTGRLEFIFKNNEWVEQHYDPFKDEVSKLNSGKIIADK